MAETNSNISPDTTTGSGRLVIRISRRHLSFATIGGAEGITYSPYSLNGGISMAANLREALRFTDVLSTRYKKTTVMVDGNVMMVPVDFYREDEAEALFFHAYPSEQGETVLHNVLPDLNAVALFSINKDMRGVITDYIPSAGFIAAMAPVWRHLHQRSFNGQRQKMFAYFHDGFMEVFCFSQNRFKFCNRFEVSNSSDAIFYLLYCWRQLAFQQDGDELHLVGDIPQSDALTEELKTFIRRTYIINPSGDFNRSPVTLISEMPYDMMTYFVKGR